MTLLEMLAKEPVSQETREQAKYVLEGITAVGEQLITKHLAGEHLIGRPTYRGE
jgi:hypothetical protein